MKSPLRAALAGAVTLAMAGAGVLVAMAPSAFAASPTAPAFEPDTIGSPAPYSNITFYNAQGQVVTSGSNLADLFAYAAGNSAFNASGTHHATTASLAFATPNHTGNSSTWNLSAFSTGTTFPLASGPASLQADTTTPVYTSDGTGGQGSNLTSFLGSSTNDTTPGYSDLVQVRLADAGLGTGASSLPNYWDATIAYNTGTTPLTVVVNATAGYSVTVPAGGWAQVFPLQTSPSITLSAKDASGPLTSGATVTNGTAVTLSATLSAPETGNIVFSNGANVLNTVAVTSATTFPVTFSDTTESSTTADYTAAFFPAVGTETGANTATASIVTGATSNAENITFGAALIGTSVVLSDNASSIAFGASETLTGTVSDADAPVTTGLAGSVQFFVGGTTSLGSVSTNDGSPGVYQLTTSALPQGTDNVTAVFTPTSPAYGPSPVSNPEQVVVAAPAACSISGSSCSDTQNVQVTVNPGTITITTPYTATNPFVLPALALSTDGTYLQSSATFPDSSLSAAQQIVVTSSLAGDPSWTLSVADTDLSDGSGGTIPGAGLGLTGGTLENATGPGAYPGTVTFTAIPALNPSPTDGAGTGPGLSATPQTFATSPAGDGTAVMSGTLTLYAATSTPAGTYTGTITFSVI